MRTGTFTTIFEGEEADIEVTVEWEGYFEPAKLSGPMEDCYPESGDMDILSVRDSDGKCVIVPQEFEEYLLDKAWEEYHEQGE